MRRGSQPRAARPRRAIVDAAPSDCVPGAVTAITVRQVMSPRGSRARRRQDRRCSTGASGGHAEQCAARADHVREHRRGDGAAVVLARRGLVDHHRDDEARVRHRREADERRHVLVGVAAPFELVRGAGLAGHAIAGDLRLGRGAAGQRRELEHARAPSRAVSGSMTCCPRPAPSRPAAASTGFSSPSVAKIV